MSTQENSQNGVEETTTTATTPWGVFIKPFADAIGKGPQEVGDALKGLCGEPGAKAIEVLANEEFASFEDISLALASLAIPKGILKKAVAECLRKQAAPVATVQPAGTSYDILPIVPDDAAWLAALKTGGTLKVNANTVISGMRAALASRSGLFELPARLSELMETHAESLDEPVGPDFFTLNDLLTRRNYAEIFSALKIDGRKYASQTKKTELMKRLDEVLWPALIGFQGQLKGWVDSWQQSFANPGTTMALLAAGMSGRGGIMPPGMTAPPSTDSLRDSADSVIEQINRCFSGLGIPVAMAMAYDAQAIKEVLENPALPAHVGAANRDQMIKLLGVNVAPDYVRLEQNITRYALAVMEYPKVTGDAELSYLNCLLMLGSQIPWERLGTPARRPGASSVRSQVREDDESDPSFDGGHTRFNTKRR
jgi:hypothetical protein